MNLWDTLRHNTLPSMGHLKTTNFTALKLKSQYTIDFTILELIKLTERRLISLHTWLHQDYQQTYHDETQQVLFHGNQ